MNNDVTTRPLTAFTALALLTTPWCGACYCNDNDVELLLLVPVPTRAYVM